MQAPAGATLVLQIGFSVLAALCVFDLTLSAQTSIDDVHVTTIPAGSALTAGMHSIQPVNDAMLHVIKTDTTLVLVPVSVTDAMQRFVTGLRQDNFEVLEDKKPQAIQHFSSEEVPVSVGIIVDTSGSMANKVDRVRDAVNQFCEAANPQDEFFLITFANTPHLVTGFTSADEIEREILFTETKGRTSLLDAIYMGLRKMKDAKYGKKAR